MCIGGKRNTSATHSLTHQPMTTNTIQAQFIADTVDEELSIDQLSDLNGAAVWGMLPLSPVLSPLVMQTAPSLAKPQD